MERRLGSVASLATVLLDELTVGLQPVGPDEVVRRRDRAFAMLAGMTWPVAAFAGPQHAPTFANECWRTTFGPSADTIATAWHAQLDRVWATGQRQHLAQHAYPTRTAAGLGEAYCSVMLQPMLGPRGEVTGAIAVCGDITDAVHARQLGVGHDDPVWGGAVDGPCDYFSRRWIAYTGLARTPTVHDDWQQAIHPEDLSRCEHAFAQAARLRSSSEIEARIRRADGEYRWHRVKFTVEERFQRWYGAATDVHAARSAETERTSLLARERAARADAEQANRLKDQFLAAVSHELRAPLTTLLLWERVLRDDRSNPAERAQALDAIHQSAQTQARLVDDLLDVARAISGKLFMDLRPLPLAATVRASVEHISPLAVDKGVTVHVDLAELVGEVEGDGPRLAQVFDNLLANAVKFTEPGGTVSVRGRRDGGSLVVTVHDTGRGIAKEFLPQVFEPFSQSDDTLTRSSGGLGLGLAIAHQLIGLHHGSLAAASEGRGHGATFTVTLPSSRAHRAARTPAAGSTGGELGAIRVLIIDDDVRVRDALALLLGRAGASIATASSSAQGTETVSSFAPHVIICDIAMPGEDGYSFIRRLRAGMSAATPAIALTAHATLADAERSVTAGFDLHLAKPIDLQLLTGSILALLAAHRGVSGPPQIA